MWALLPPQPLKPWPPTTKPPPHRHSTAVQSSQEMGIFGRTVITALKSDEPEERNGEKSKPKAPQTPPPPQQRQESEDKQQQRQLSGADVLMALQRATSKKAKKPKATANSGGGKYDKSGKKNEISTDFSNVRPLRIEAEWSHRLEELESRLQQLLHI
ncbi:uncharacterized protein [Henckelia pumila]|uniref:uncharacterized protein n=1 Tax=Henckelia pumila TaxID=405737 RepID=UPI003C6DC5BA